jgi:hypothetical protein
MSISCVGTCSVCGTKRSWLSDTLSIQVDDGSLKCLRHPGESFDCIHDHGLTLGMASARGRLFRETFFVCRCCGRDGETIEPWIGRDYFPELVNIKTTMKWVWGSNLIAAPILVWMKWWQVAAALFLTAVFVPFEFQRQNKKEMKRAQLIGLPRADAPGEIQIPAPTVGLCENTVVGQLIGVLGDGLKATGNCCKSPSWIEVFRVADTDRVPCCVCGKGVMLVSDLAIH